MPEPLHRKFFQIHLSTALILMLAAGGMIGGNIGMHQSEYNLKLPLSVEDRKFIADLSQRRLWDLEAAYVGHLTKISVKTQSYLRVAGDDTWTIFR